MDYEKRWYKAASVGYKKIARDRDWKGVKWGFFWQFQSERWCLFDSYQSVNWVFFNGCTVEGTHL